VEFVKPLFDSLAVMLEPVGHQHWLSVGGFDKVLQRVQFAVVDGEHTLVLTVDSPICHLGELISQSCRVPGVHFLAAEGNHQLRAHGVVGLPFPLGEGNPYLVEHTLRHLEVVGGPHGDGDIGNLLVDGLLRAVKGLVGEHHLTIPLVRLEVPGAVVGDVPTQPLTHVQEAELRP
jgi:hypothetical protein